MDNEIFTLSDKQRVLRFVVKATAYLVCFLLLVITAVVFYP